MLKRLRSQAGQTAPEYLGALLLVSVVIAALALTDAGSRIGWHAQVLVCRIAGGESCETLPGDPSAPPLSKCVVSVSDKSIQGSVKVLVFKLEGGVEGIYQVAADGSTTVTLKANAGAGLQFSTPGVKVDGDGTEASSPKGDFSVTGKGELSRTWIFPTQDDANTFIDRTVQKVIDEHDGIPDFLESGDDYQLPKEDSTTIYGGVSVNASISAGAGGAYAQASGGAEAGLGAQYYTNGDTTYFFQAKANIGGKAGLAFAGGFGVDGDGKVLIGITYDKDGKAKSMTVQGQGSVAGGLDFSGTQEGLDSVIEGIEKAKVGIKSQQGKRVTFQSTLDLTDPANLAAAQEFLHGTDPTTGQSVSLAKAAGDLLGRFDDSAQTNVQLYDLDQSSAGIDIDGSVLGFSLKYASQDAALDDAWFDPGPGGLQPWYACSDAVKN